MSAQARTGETRVLAASDNIAASAGSVEELAASISEIAAQARSSTEVAGRAVAEARRTIDHDVGTCQCGDPDRRGGQPDSGDRRSRPTCWRSTPRSKPRAPATPDAALRWSQPK